MCIIAIKPEGRKMFSDSEIKTMFDHNPNGSGYMYYDRKAKKVIVRKGFMTIDELLQSLHKQSLTSVNVVLHFRITTSGYSDELNCHPFPVYDVNATFSRTDLAVAHNGILRDYEPIRKSPINDTQVFIHEVLRKLSKGFIKSQNCLKLIEELIGTNKLAFMDETGKVTTIGKFISDNGYLYSNDSYKPRDTRFSVYKPTKANNVIKKSVYKPTTKPVENGFVATDYVYNPTPQGWKDLSYYGLFEDLDGDDKYDDIWN